MIDKLLHHSLFLIRHLIFSLNYEHRTRKIKVRSFFALPLLRWSLTAVSLIGCTSSEIKPIDIFPEDMCANCRMAISDEAFASEIITIDREVFKFDDIGCMDEFVRKSEDVNISARYVKDFESTSWLQYEKATIVQTNMKTPMGSGKIAFADSLQAGQFAEFHPGSTKKTKSCCEGEPGTH